MTVTILIVDDDAGTRRLLRTWIEAAGAAVSEAATAEEALAVVRAQGPPSAALCDIRLPGRDGLWLAAQLRDACPETAVVITSGVNEFAAAVTSLQAGVVDYVEKPFTDERVGTALRRALLAHQSRRALASMQRELEQRRAQITDALAELEVNMASSVDALLAMVRARSLTSYEHARRVARLSVNLAMALQVGEPALSDVERAALLHNLGRLAMPDALLNRPEATLSQAERTQLRSYPLHAHAMLKNVPFLAVANEIAVAAHERYDGSGFPHGRRGTEIPLGARIIGVADAFDELVSGVGQPRVTPAHALDILAVNRASEFDPLVVGALRVLHGAAPRR